MSSCNQGGLKKWTIKLISPISFISSQRGREPEVFEKSHLKVKTKDFQSVVPKVVHQRANKTSSGCPAGITILKDIVRSASKATVMWKTRVKLAQK